MSLLSTVEHAIKSYKVEQAKINDSIKLYKEILQSLTPQPKAGSKDSESEDDAAIDTDTSPKEKEDIELLERALEKALRVRTGSEPSNKDRGRNKLSGAQKEPGAPSVASADVRHSSVAPKRNQAAIKSTSESASLDRKGHREAVITAPGSRPLTGHRPGRPKNTNTRNIIPKRPPSSDGAVHHRASRKSQRPVSSSGSPDHISTSLSKNKTIRSSALGGDDPGRAASVPTPSPNDNPTLSRADGSGASSLLQQGGIPPELVVKWKSLRSKQNRLWDKVIAVQRKPEPGRGHFMERMRATSLPIVSPLTPTLSSLQFPEDRPCGGPDRAAAPADRLTHRGRDLIQICPAKELLAQQTPETTAAPDWKAWDRWRPAGGRLPPSGANGVWGDVITAPLPLTVTYTTEAELQELERLRMRVALLQQEIYLEQALWDTLSPQLSSIQPGPGCPKPSALRDLYSLLGEGGERFPAIVLDSEPD
ncbi:tubulin epsilon and delta complex protein 2 isoform X2 [Mugil cephalus]|nr:tubulin epsilon and delta complex protein 2 isoform X2 [Mugil cephalus]